MKILILGGGINQLPFILKAKEIGYTVILCDYAPDCEGKQYADVYYRVSTYDYEAVKAAAMKERVDGIITNSEPVLHIVSKLTDELQLPSVPQSVMERFLNKDRMRELLTPSGLSDVDFMPCENVEQAVDFFRRNKTKMILKPVDSSASRGVFSIYSENDITAHFQEAMAENRKRQIVLLERYVEGTEFTVDGICINHKHTTIGISRKKHFDYNENVANELFFSYYDDQFDYDALRRYNDSVVHATGLPFGMTHAEYKYSNGAYHLIEIAARGGGTYISTMIVPFLSDTDTVRILLESSCGACTIENFLFPRHAKGRAAVLRFFDTPNQEEGIVKAINGLDFLKSERRIVGCHFGFSVGDYVRPATSDIDRIGYYIAVADNAEELRRLMAQVAQKVQIILEK